MTASNHAHWDCSQGVNTALMLGACLDVLGGGGQSKERLVEDFGKICQDIFSSATLACILQLDHIQTRSGKAVTITVEKTSGYVSSQSLTKLVLDTSNLPGNIGQLPGVIASFQEAELTVTDYAAEFQLEDQTLLEIFFILLALDYLKVETISCSALPMGEGSIEHTDGGVIPVPSPATLHLMLGMRTSSGPRGITDDLVTSSACALLRQLVMKDGVQGSLPPVFVPQKVGLGANQEGDRTVRLILGKKENEQRQSPALSGTQVLWKMDTLNHLEANLDDTTAEALAFGIEILMKHGAIDAWVTPIVMKKGRAAHTLHCLCHSSEETTNKLLTTMFRQTTTLGVRIHRNVERAALCRSLVSIQTPFIDQERQGKVDVKVGYLGDEIVSVKPEFDHCKAISVATNVPLKRISDVTIQEFYKTLETEAKENIELSR